MYMYIYACLCLCVSMCMYVGVCVSIGHIVPFLTQRTSPLTQHTYNNEQRIFFY